MIAICISKIWVCVLHCLRSVFICVCCCPNIKMNLGFCFLSSTHFIVLKWKINIEISTKPKKYLLLFHLLQSFSYFLWCFNSFSFATNEFCSVLYVNRFFDNFIMCVTHRWDLPMIQNRFPYYLNLMDGINGKR